MRRWGNRGGEASKILLRESSTRSRLQVFFEGDSQRRVGECNIGSHPPRSVLRGMWHLAGVVLSQPSTQIVGDPDVEMFAIKTFQNVDVFHVPTLARQEGRESNRLREKVTVYGKGSHS